MEFVTAIALVMMALSNIAVFKQLQKLQLHPTVINLSPPVTGLIECHCGEGLVEEPQEILDQEKSVNTPSVPDESYFAWKNHKEEPTVAPPSPHGPPPIPGPLERPYGFSR